jgi:transcription antitermination factor NusG
VPSIPAACPVPASGPTPPWLAPRIAWFALRTRSRFEFVARDALDAKGYEAWLPTFDETVRWTDREKVINRALFPGYIFARFDRFDAARALQTRGIVQILGTGNDEYSQIDDDVIADLRRVVDSRVTVAPCAYVAGASVTIARGPFAGVAGVIARVKGATTLTIPVAILGRSVSVQIDASDVEAASA